MLNWMKRTSPVFVVALVVLAALGGSLLPTEVKASMTAPTLAIRSAQAEQAEGGALVTVTGAFPFDDVVGREYGMELFVRAVDEGQRFLCFSTRWGPMTGSDELFEKGLDEENVDDISLLAVPSTSAHFVRIEPGQIQVQLEPDFPLGKAEAQFFVLYNGVPVFSNPVAFEIVEGLE